MRLSHFRTILRLIKVAEVGTERRLGAVGAEDLAQIQGTSQGCKAAGLVVMTRNIDQKIQAAIISNLGLAAVDLQA